REVFTNYKEKIFGAAFKMTHSADEAEELVQEIFVRLWTKRAHLSAVENPASYLFTIAYHCIFAHFKTNSLEKNARLQAFSGVQIPAGAADEPLLRKEKMEALENLINHLPPRQ